LKPSRSRGLAGWTAVVASTSFATFWAYWGAIECFHEGWYFREWYRNLGLAFVQYLPWMFVPMAAGLVALWRRSFGVVLHVGLAGAAMAFFGVGQTAGSVLIALPLLGLAALYAFGSAEPVRRARLLLVAVPILTAIVAGARPGWRAISRPAEVDLTAQRITANGVDLIWAPAGPGWPDRGLSWAEATQRCDRLTDDGSMLASTPQGIWRLPTVEEAVRSQIYRGRNAGGAWDTATRQANYRVQPDKDAPLWNRYSQVIYWWTADDAGPDRAYRIVYNGLVNPVPKKFGPLYLACRCVRSAP